MDIGSLKFRFALILATVFYGTGINAQSHEPQEHHHEHPKNEIGTANYLVYLTHDQEFAYGLHLHYLRAIVDSRFGFGLGYEQVFDENKHRTLGVIGSYMPVEHLVLHVTPGILFLGQENVSISFAVHAEAAYEFEINNIHIGPAVELAYSSEGYHLSIGLHLAYGF